MIDEKLCDEALQRFARSADGRLFYLKLQKVLMGVPATDKRGALRENLGRRKLASELMAVIAEAMSEDIGDGANGNTGSERPIVFSLARPAAVATGPRGVRRRVGPGPADGATGGAGF